VALILTRTQLVLAGSCDSGLVAFDMLYPSGDMRIKGGWTREAQLRALLASPRYALWPASVGLLPLLSMRGAYLRRAHLSRAYLSSLDLRGANLSGAKLDHADLSGADLSGTKLSNADLRGANLHGANLRGANLHGANLCGASLCGASLSGAKLRGARRHATADPAIPGWRVVRGKLSIRKELKEVLAAPFDLKEWIDVVILALDGAWRAGYEPKEIAAALEAKLEKNEKRSWPDWRECGEGKAIEHVREKE